MNYEEVKKKYANKEYALLKLQQKIEVFGGIATDFQIRSISDTNIKALSGSFCDKRGLKRQFDLIDEA